MENNHRGRGGRGRGRGSRGGGGGKKLFRYYQSFHEYYPIYQIEVEAGEEEVEVKVV